MKGYVRLKDPDEEIFLGEGAGCRQFPVIEEIQYRIWDQSGTTILVPAERLVTIRLGTGQRPEGYEPIGNGVAEDEAPVLSVESE
jgi:hypothetical protein